MTEGAGLDLETVAVRHAARHVDLGALKNRSASLEHFAIPWLEERGQRRSRADSRIRASSVDRFGKSYRSFSRPSLTESLKFRMPRPIPRPISGRRFAP